MKTYLSQLFSLALGVCACGASAASLPTISCSQQEPLECTSSNGAWGVVTSTVQDADGDGLMLVWSVNGLVAHTAVIAAGVASNAVTLSFTNQFAAGTNEVVVTVTDDGTNMVSCSSMVVVQDTTPPVIRSIIATPNVLWPPNHRMVPVRLAVRAHDACGPVRWHIDSITSNETEDALGSGHTAPDYLIRGPHQALLRAERSGRGSGRIYTLTVVVSDESGNSSTGTVKVLVPHDHRRGWDWPADNAGDQPGNNGKSKSKSKGNGHRP